MAFSACNGHSYRIAERPMAIGMPAFRVALTRLLPTPIFFPGFLGMPSTPFGEHLKREREMRGVSLAEVSAATRINTRFLEAIEKEKWEELPGGAFNRGFIRAIARFLGLDEDGMVAEYALETKGTLDARPTPERPGEIPRNWQPAIVVAIVVVLVVLLGWFVFHHFGARLAPRSHRHTAEIPRTALDRLLAGRGAEHETLIVQGGSH
jgi:transcriptional regulator with XRE-family HTH domain